MLILGSNSKRRQEILSYFSIPFKVAVSGFDEDAVSFQGFAPDYVQMIAAGKAAALAKLYPKNVILTADTTVLLEGHILNKPLCLDEARSMLQRMSGKKHEVHTGVCVRVGNAVHESSECTRVEFNHLDENQIEAYIKHVDVLDKAGSYGIQGSGSLLVKGIEGCFYNVMGLPINTTHRLLQKAGIHLWHAISSSQSFAL